MGILLLVLIIGVLLIINYSAPEEPLIGGCAGVSLEYLQECCDNWALNKNISRVQCTGEWKIENNKCSWKCES